MFSFFKKKQPTQQENTYDLSTTKYSCVGVNYNKVQSAINDLGEKEELEELKDELFQKLKLKVYTLDEIHKIKDLVGYDIWNAFHWIPRDQEASVKKSMQFGYWWEGERPGLLTDEQIKKQNLHIKPKTYYTRVEIQTASLKMGYDVYDMNLWRQMQKTSYAFPDGIGDFEVLTKRDMVEPTDLGAKAKRQEEREAEYERRAEEREAEKKRKQEEKKAASAQKKLEKKNAAKPDNEDAE